MHAKTLRNSKYYMSLVYLIAMQSEDTSTKVGAVIVGPDQEIRSTGYNGLPRGCLSLSARFDKPEKYFWFEHAERNAIYNAARMGISVKDCILFTQGIPCADCARAIIQSGISIVVTHSKWNISISEKWKESSYRTLQMFRESGVQTDYYNEDIILNIKSLQNGIEFL